ncbi:substrate-binding domain-containing protein [Streptomyces cyaneofuscatus]|uniref:substrate-binding domain-containing protein n=1 Tax=Streptomyces cyaneofuscatus TaxID=66883 RepID=UPI00380A2CF6
MNDRVQVRDLALADIRRIYAGEIRNRRELGGSDLEIPLVSRGADSGTRQMFQRRVLDHDEPARRRGCGSAARTERPTTPWGPGSR